MRSRANAAVVLMYHSVTRYERDPFWIRVTPENFVDHLRELRRIADVVPLHAIFDERSGPRVAITFDDGYADNDEIARPLLEDAAMDATVFVTSDIIAGDGMFWWDRLEWLLLDTPSTRLVGIDLPDGATRLELATVEDRLRAMKVVQEQLRTRPPREISDVLEGIEQRLEPPSTGIGPARRMTPHQLQELARSPSVEIGAHTRHHPMLSTLHPSQQMAEIAGSKRELEHAIGCPVTAFAFPFGSPESFDDHTVRCVGEAGFALACTTEFGRVEPTTDCYRVPRVPVHDCTGRQFARRLKRALARGRP